MKGSHYSGKNSNNSSRSSGSKSGSGISLEGIFMIFRALSYHTTIKKVIYTILIVILILVGSGLILIGVSPMLVNFEETKGYESTMGVYKGLSDDCDLIGDNRLCKAIYEYQVDGVTYTVSPNLYSNEENFESGRRVYYNPNNPGESIIYVVVEGFISLGAIIVITPLAIFVVNRCVLKKFRHKVSDDMDRM